MNLALPHPSLRAWRHAAVAVCLAVGSCDAVDPGDTGDLWEGSVPDDRDQGTDLDGDGWSPGEGDCDDGDPSIHGSAPEVCGDGLDNDCDGEVDGDDPDCP